jgi:hypothetical protein
VYDVVANEWRQQTGTVPPLFSPSTGIGGDSPVALVIAAPISSYGVTVFVKHRPTDYAKVHVYKHRQ